MTAIGVGLATNTVSKALVALATGGVRFALSVLACLLPAIAAVAAALLLR